MVTTIAVRVKPGSSRTRVGGRHEGVFGPALVIAVMAPPVDGKATEAVRVALAAALDLPARDVALHKGATGRDKLFTVDCPGPGEAAAVAARAAALRDA
ncbi:DUF167 domain-containing protein [Hamadaea tsunoensis]|uniref:DUF167 domain-containing protein n=1 Tax=Hamadaea tsunoensis TaxID=53368 RepID=UPI0003F5AF6E|nr:DUF167 domain-containing protein [Hamadaea tsunoensis]